MNFSRNTLSTLSVAIAATLSSGASAESSPLVFEEVLVLSLIHISEPTRPY